MAHPRLVRADEVEILVARELRKAGVELTTQRLLARRELSAKDGGEYVVELCAVTGDHPTGRDVLIEFRNQREAIPADALRAFAAKAVPPPLASDVGQASADEPVRLLPQRDQPPATLDPRPPALRVMFSTSGYEPAAVREAKTLGIALLNMADGAAAFRRSQWSMGEQTPAWVPEYMAEVVDLGPGDTVRRELLMSRKSKPLLGLTGGGS